jgi:hypothetical protein
LTACEPPRRSARARRWVHAAELYTWISEPSGLHF